MWSQAAIPGGLRILMVDGSCNAQGWEADFSDRVFNVLRKKSLALVGEFPLRASSPPDLAEAVQDQDAFNCIFLMCHGAEGEAPPDSRLSSFWAWLSAPGRLAPKLLAVCTYETYDADSSQYILDAKDSFAQFAVVPRSEMTARAAGLFFMKFFVEMNLHTEDHITGKMAWFSHAKARELLKRRNLPGQMGIRC